MSTNYRRGRAYEYRAIRQLQAEGYYAGRSAGSHGLFDVWAINGFRWRLIQVKSGRARMTRAEQAAFRELPVPERTTKEIWTYKKGLTVEVL